MHLDELNWIIPELPGFDHFEQGYSSAVRWGRVNIYATKDEAQNEALV